MKICLVRPPFPTKDLQPYPPFSLVALAPYFAKFGEVSICDMQAGGDIHKFLSYGVGVFAFSAFSSQLSIVNNVIAYMKKNYRRPHYYVVGGAGVTSSPSYAEKMVPEADCLVAGDGETFTFNEWGKTTISTPHFDWANHKVPNWSLIKYKRYLHSCGLAVETSRGCPFNCVWCTAHLVHGKRWRPRTPESVVAELKFLHENYKSRKFYFTDDNATVDPKRWLALMQVITDAKLDVTLTVPEGIQAHHLNRETLLLMKKAGFKHITIGAESGCDRVLNHIIDKGGLTVQQIENVVRESIAVGLDVSCFFVIGTPGETLEEAEATVDFAEKLRGLGAYSCIVRNAIPILGTRMFNIAKAEGYLTVPEEKLLNMNFVHGIHHLMQTPEWTPEQITGLVVKAKRQDAQHILRQKRGHILRVGLPRLFRNPRAAVARFRQLRNEAKEVQDKK